MTKTTICLRFFKTGETVTRSGFIYADILPD